VAAGVAVLCLLPALLAARPAPSVSADPAALRELVLASAARPYSGDIETHGSIAVPDVPVLSDVAGLFKPLRLRAWRASPEAWRVAVLQVTGERDIYRTQFGTYTWDYERNLTTLAVGDAPVRMPYAADLVPPDLARWLLAGEARVSAIEARRVAGVAAAGLRITPHSPDTTIGRVDIWADPDTGLPLWVEVHGRGIGAALFTSRFLDVEQATPPVDVLTPGLPPGAGLTLGTAEDVTAALNTIAPGRPLPGTLAGRTRLGPAGAQEVTGLAAYGPGLDTFVVLALPGRTGLDALTAARDRGALPVSLPNADAYQTSTVGVNGLIVRTTQPDRRSRRTYVIAGPVTTAVLTQAAAELLQ
jgi:hypothetical protein